MEVERQGKTVEEKDSSCAYNSTLRSTHRSTYPHITQYLCNLSVLTCSGGSKEVECVGRTNHLAMLQVTSHVLHNMQEHKKTLDCCTPLLHQTWWLSHIVMYTVQKHSKVQYLRVDISHTYDPSGRPWSHSLDSLPEEEETE